MYLIEAVVTVGGSSNDLLMSNGSWPLLVIVSSNSLLMSDDPSLLWVLVAPACVSRASQ
jgi:hypothetical protein